jgi:hypothetical protein
MEYWIEPVNGKHRCSMEPFEKKSESEALSWISQKYVQGDYKVVVRNESKRTKCCGKVSRKGSVVREINPFAK